MYISKVYLNGKKKVKRKKAKAQSLFKKKNLSGTSFNLYSAPLSNFGK